MRAAGLQLKWSKTSFDVQQVRFLRFVVGRDGLKPDPSKLEAVRMLPPPRDTSELRSQLGLFTFYRRFVAGFADIAEPLHRLLRKNEPWAWQAEHSAAWQTLKDKLCSPPTLAMPQWDKPFAVHCDASGVGLGAVLTQESGGRVHPIAFASKTLTAAERNWPVYEQEAAAVQFALKSFEHYLRNGLPVDIWTDHRALLCLQRNPTLPGRLQRWATYMQQFPFTIRHRAGVENGDADALSRFPLEPRPDSTVALLTVEQQGDAAGSQLRVGEAPKAQDTSKDPAWMTRLHTAQLEDEQCQKVKQFLTDGMPVVDNEEDRARWGAISRMAQSCALDTSTDLIVCTPRAGGKGREARPWIPLRLRAALLQELHTAAWAGHLGVARVYDKLSERAWWPTMYADTLHWVRSCTECQRARPPRDITGKLQSVVATRPWQIIALDHTGPFKASEGGNRHILVATCLFTRWCEAVPVPRVDAETTAKHLELLFMRFGFPEVLLTDRGTAFINATVDALCTRMGIDHRRTSGYAPQTNGSCERLNQTLVRMLSKVVADNQRDWDKWLPMLAFAYNSSRHESTGETPAFLMLGRDMAHPLDVQMPVGMEEQATTIQQYRELLLDRLDRSQEQARARDAAARMARADRHDATHSEPDLVIGDAVWLYTPAVKPGLSRKLTLKWRGPFRIAAAVSPVNYLLRSSTGRRLKQVVHVRRLRRVVQRAARPIGTVDLTEDDDFDPHQEEEADLQGVHGQHDEQLVVGDHDGQEAQVGGQADTLPEDMYLIEKLLDRRKRGRGWQYLVKWQDYGEDECTWEPAGALPRNIVQEFLDSQKSKT